MLQTRSAAVDTTNKPQVNGNSNEIDTSMAFLSKRARHMEVSMDTGLAGDETAEKRPRSGAMEIALAVDWEVAKEHAPWWHPEPKPKVEAHQSSVAEGVGGAIPARVADECNRVLRQELSPAEEERHAELVAAAKHEKLPAWKTFDVCEPRKQQNVSEQIAQTRWVITWKMVDGRRNVKARLVATGHQDPDRLEGIAETSGRVSLK